MWNISYLISFIPLLIFSLVLWDVIRRLNQFGKRPLYLLLSILCMAVTGGAALSYHFIPQQYISYTSYLYFVLLGILYLVSVYLLEYSIHCQRIEKSFLMKMYKTRAARVKHFILGLIFWLIAYSVLYFIVYPRVKDSDDAFLYPMFATILLFLFSIFYIITVNMVSQYAFNLMEGIIRRKKLLFRALILITIGVTILLLFFSKEPFPLVVYLPINICYLVRLYNEYLYYLVEKYERNFNQINSAFALKNEFVSNVLDSSLSEDIEIVSRTIAMHLENVTKTLPVNEFKITGYYIIRRIEHIMKVDSLSLVAGHCSLLSDTKKLKMVKTREELNDLIIKETYDIRKIAASLEADLDEWSEKLIKRLLEGRQPLEITNMPETMIGIHRLIKLYPVFIKEQLECILVIFKDHFNTLYPEEETAIVNILDDLKIILSIMYNKHVQMEKNRLQNEFEIARELQTSILPPRIDLPGYEYEYTMLPTTEVGGDIYDLIKTGDGIFWGIGDVAGHGLPAGIMALLQQAAFQASVDMALSLGHTPLPHQIYNTVNRVIYELNTRRIGSDKFMTQVYLYEKEGKFIYAGNHTEALLYKANIGKVIPLEGFIKRVAYLGFIKDLDASAAEDFFQMDKEDILLLYTDGLTEARNHYNKQFGLEHCKEILQSHADLSCKEIMQKILEDLYRHTRDGDFKKHNGHLADDTSIIILRRN